MIKGQNGNVVVSVCDSASCILHLFGELVGGVINLETVDEIKIADSEDGELLVDFVRL